jgi:hypothetical protein
MHVSRFPQIESSTAGTRPADLCGEQLYLHLLEAHGRTPLELIVTLDHLAALHRFEHFEASAGLVEVDHDHGARGD